MNAATEHGHLVDAADLLATGPTDLDIVDALVEEFGIEPLAIIERLICMDFVSVRREVMP